MDNAANAQPRALRSARLVTVCALALSCSATRQRPIDPGERATSPGRESSGAAGEAPRPAPAASEPGATASGSAGSVAALSPSVETPTAHDAGAPSTSSGSLVQVDAGARPTQLRFDFTTVTQGGKYAPRHCGVAWVADGEGRWVHTFELWCSSTFFGPLDRYIRAGGPNFTSLLGMPLVPVPPDVITSATLPSHRAHARSWDLKGPDGMEVPDGPYSVVVEIAESEQEAVFELPFVKSGARRTVVPKDGPVIVDAELVLE